MKSNQQIPRVLKKGDANKKNAKEQWGMEGKMKSNPPVVFKIQKRENKESVKVMPKKHVELKEVVQKPILRMENACKFMDGSLCRLFPDLLKYLSGEEQDDFTVIGVMGGLGTGKSSIANSLIQNSPFRVQSLKCLMQCTHQTVGIDVFVTEDRKIILDSQPLLCASVVSSILSISRSMIPKSKSAETFMEDQGRRMGLLLLSICHVLIVVEDDLQDLTMCQFVKTLRMLQKGIPNLMNAKLSKSGSIAVSDFVPEIIFVNTKVPLNFQTTAYMNEHQNILNQFFKDTLFRKNGFISPTGSHSNKPTEGNVNFYFLPSRRDPSYNLKLQLLRTLLDRFPRKNWGNHYQVSEQNWYQNVCSLWTLIQKSHFLEDYEEFSSVLDV